MKTLLIALLMLAWSTSALAWSAGPLDARTNAPGETTCTECHASFPLNSGTGSLTVSGVPGAWQPLTAYDLVVNLADPDAQRWGFEFTVLDGDGNSTGTLQVLDANTQLSTTGTRTYAKHTTAGTQLGTTVSADWTVRWTAPADGAGDITIYLAGNGANGNFASSGDRIYTVSTIWTESPVSAAGVPLASVDLKAAYPNPFNPRTSIAYELAKDSRVRLEIYAVDGSLVRRLVDRHEVAGPHSVMWDGMNEQGRGAPSGVYLYRIVADGVVASLRMTLVR